MKPSKNRASIPKKIKRKRIKDENIFYRFASVGFNDVDCMPG
jgi:hypothetical protein